MAAGVMGSLRRAAGFLAALCMAAVFVLFVFGVGMRYVANRPLSWIDEAVTLLSVWGTFWTAAFVLKWPEHIAFDVLFNAMAPERQRFWLLEGDLKYTPLTVNPDDLQMVATRAFQVSDIARFFLSSPALSYSTVFASEAGLFVVSAFMAVWVHRAQAKTAQRRDDVGAITSPAVAEGLT